METANNSAYTRKPLWQWVLIYIILGGLAYGIVYYLFVTKNNTYSTSVTGQTPAVLTQ